MKLSFFLLLLFALVLSLMIHIKIISTIHSIAQNKQSFNYALPNQLKAMCQICIDQEKRVDILHFPRQ